MNEIIQSFILVTTGANFWAWSSTIIVLGMFVGWKQNKGMSGFKRSIYTLIPFALIYFFSSANRVYEYTRIYGVGVQSYNNLISIVLISILYAFGLFIGHNIKNKAIESAVKESGVPEHDKPRMIATLKETL